MSVWRFNYLDIREPILNLFQNILWQSSTRKYELSFLIFLSKGTYLSRKFLNNLYNFFLQIRVK